MTYKVTAKTPKGNLTVEVEGASKFEILDLARHYFRRAFSENFEMTWGQIVEEKREMKYGEMTRFLNDNGILVMQPVIASELDAQLETEITDDEYENICTTVYEQYLDSIEEPDIWWLVNDELVKRGHKEV